MVEAGINEIGIIVGDTSDEIIAAVGDGSRWGVDVTYIPQDAPLGLAHCVLIARDFLGDDDFVMYLGDNLLQQGSTSSSTRSRPSAEPAAPTTRGHARRADPARPRRRPAPFGVAEIDPDGEVVRLVEKPAHPPSDLALVGVYLFDPTSTTPCARSSPPQRGELEITDAIQWLIDQGHRVRHEVLERLVDRHRQEGSAAREQPARSSRRSSRAIDGTSTRRRRSRAAW